MKVHRRWLLLALLPVVGVALWGWWGGVESERQTRRSLNELLARKAELEKHNSALRREVKGLREERAARERVARESLGVAAPEEVVVLLPSPTPTATPTPQRPMGRPRDH